MEKALIAILLIGLIIVVFQSRRAPKGDLGKRGGIRRLKGEEMKRLKEKIGAEDGLVVDVRSEEEYRAGHVAGSINLPLTNQGLGAAVEKVDDCKERPLILYCRSGSRSNRAAQELLEQGFQEIYSAPGVGQYKYDLVTYTEVRGKELLTMKDEEDAILVDARSEEAYAEGHIEGAINIPFAKLQENPEQLPKEKKILLYCATGKTSTKCAQFLTEKGFQKIYNSVEGVNSCDIKLVK